MCDPNAYLVIDRVADLPGELPKIYQRLVRAS
jgi:nitric oxide reductase activation protein